jgi:Transglycosylase-like domain
MRRLVALVALVVFVPHAALAYATDPTTVKRQIRRAWMADDAKAIRVAACESSLDPEAVDPSHTYFGLWQFSVSTWKAYGGPGNDPRAVNAYRQTQIAWNLYRSRGWAPWPTCGKR